MPDYPLTPWHYGRAHGNLRTAGGTCSVRTAGQTLGTAQGTKAVDRVTTAKDGGARPRNCATLAIEVSGCYLFHSCLCPMHGRYRPKEHIKSAVMTTESGVRRV